MKTKKATRYYCDHCKKSGGGKAAMIAHEKRCFSNLDFECGYCKVAERSQVRPSLTIQSIALVGLSELRTLTENCPGCIVAAFIQARKMKLLTCECEEWRVCGACKDSGDFNFQMEREEFWREFNDQRNDSQPVY